MAKPNGKQVKTDLEEWAILEGQIKSLRDQRSAAVAPIQAKADKQITKAAAEFDTQINEATGKQQKLSEAINAEFSKGFIAKENRYSTKSIESDSALIEVNSKSTREIDAAAWLKEVPETDKEKTEFWATVSILIGKAEKFRSDIVAKLATKKVTHSVSIKLK